MEETRIRIAETARKGYPAFWERGGGFTNTGEASIICGRDGSPKKAIYVRQKGHLANAEHALVLVSKGDFIVTAEHWRNDFEIRVCQVVDLEKEEYEYEYEGEKHMYRKWYAIVKEKYHFDNGRWNDKVPEFLNAAIEAAKDKATCYHCREPHYVEFDVE